MMKSYIPGPAYRIITSRLEIRCWDPKDAQLLKTAIDENLDHLRPWMLWAHNEPEALERKIQRLRLFRGEFDLGKDFVYGIFLREKNIVVGGTGLHTGLGNTVREIGYWIHKKYTGSGLATEATASLIRVAFGTSDVARIEIHCDPRNFLSASIPRKLGFTHEATLKNRTPWLNGTKKDSMIWTLFRDDYPSSPATLFPIEAFDAGGRRVT